MIFKAGNIQKKTVDNETWVKVSENLENLGIRWLKLQKNRGWRIFFQSVVFSYLFLVFFFVKLMPCVKMLLLM